MNTYKLYLPKAIAIAALTLGCSVPAANAFHVKDGLLLDSFDNPFIMRGVNHAHTWYETRTPQALKDIASTKANAVRIVLSNGAHKEGWGRDSESQVKAIIEQMKQLQMVSIVEVHDATGYPEKAGAAHLSTAVDYWIDIQDALKGEENTVIINIANEPFGNQVEPQVWIDDHIDAVKRLREAGFTHTLMIDAANWGQDWEEIMLEHAPEVFAADPLKNSVFSIHMYQVYNNRNVIDNYLRTFVYDHKLPLVVGEFGADHGGEDVDEASILELADRYNVGYLGWSWSGNSGGVESLDITLGYDLNNLSEWGDFLINSEYGITATAQTCSCFTEGSGLVYPPKAVPFSHTMLEDTASTIDLQGEDIDGDIDASLIVTPPAHGTLSGSGKTLQYTPDTGFDGVDSFDYKLIDEDGELSNTATATVVVASAGGANGGPACTVNFVREMEWDTGSHLKLEIANNQPNPIVGYELTFNLGETEQLSSGYNGEYSTNGQTVNVSVDAARGNGTIGSQETAELSYLISKASGPAVQPAYYFLNDLTCADASFTGAGNPVSSSSANSQSSSRASSSSQQNASSSSDHSSDASQSSAFSFSSSSKPNSSSSDSSNSSTPNAQCSDMCKWYLDAPRPLCENQDSGWGYENGQSCIGINTCEVQSGDGGVITVCNGTVSSTASSSSNSSNENSSASSVNSNLTASSASSSSSAPASSPNVTCEVTYLNQWGSGYQLDITVTNNSTQSISGWNLMLDFGHSVQVTGSWNADITETATGLAASDINWNGNLNAGQSTSFGLQGKSTDTISKPICSIQ